MTPATRLGRGADRSLSYPRSDRGGIGDFNPREGPGKCKEVGMSSSAIRAYAVYVLQNPLGVHYIGVSDDVPRRLGQHNRGVSRWTRNRGPWFILWQGQPMTLGAARRLENLLKRQKGGAGLRRLLALCAGPLPGAGMFPENEVHSPAVADAGPPSAERTEEMAEERTCAVGGPDHYSSSPLA